MAPQTLGLSFDARQTRLRTRARELQEFDVRHSVSSIWVANDRCAEGQCIRAPMPFPRHRSALFANPACGRREGLHRVSQLLEAQVNPIYLRLCVPDALKVPFQRLAGGLDRTFQVGDPIRQCGTGRRNGSRGPQICAATASSPPGSD